MNILLDTHVAIWSVDEPEALPPRIRSLIRRDAERVFVSTVTLWEIAIKRSLGRRSAPKVGAGAALRYFEDAGYLPLAISNAHALALEQLPLHHADPFDRMLVSQALHEGLRLITSDKIVASYDAGIMLF